MVGTRWNTIDPLGRLKKNMLMTRDTVLGRSRRLMKMMSLISSMNMAVFLRNITETCVKSWTLMNGGRSSCKNRLFVKACCSRRTI